MSNNDELVKDIREIKWHQEAIDSSMELLIKANKKEILKEIIEFFGKSKRRAQIYIAVNGILSVTDITELLGIKQPNVSRELSKLKDEGLIEIRDISDKGYIYQKRKVENILKISKILKKQFGL